MSLFRQHRVLWWVAPCLLAWSIVARAQTCFDANDLDASTKAALENSGKRYFDMVAHGDSAGLKQNSIPSLAADFSRVEAAVKESQPNLESAHAAVRPPYLLKVEGAAPLEHAEFLCGVFGKSGQTASSAEFAIPNLPPGNYGFVALDATGAKNPYTVSFVLQQMGSDWKVGGLYIKETSLAGHDYKWFADKARAFKAKGQNRDAWFYYLQARELAVPVSFMYTQVTDNLYDESQQVKPMDLPSDSSPIDLTSDGKTYKVTALFPLGVGEDLELIVKYQAADVSNTAKTFQENTAVMKALLAKFPELRDAFDGVVARGVEPSGRDYGTLLPMKEIK